MKRKTFDRIIDATNAILAFDNDQTEHVWRVALHDGWMLVRLDECDYDTEKIVMSYYQIPFESILDCERLYDEIVRDVVICFGDAMYAGKLADYGLFAEVARSDDEGFAELLSYFGKIWSEFVQDVFFVFGSYVEMCELIDESTPVESVPADRMADYHLVDKVFMHLNCAEAFIDYGADVSRYWQVTCAHDEIWYRSYFIIMTDDGLIDAHCDDWGHFAIDDAVAMDALADAVAADIDGKACIIDYDECLFDLLGLEIEELEED